MIIVITAEATYVLKLQNASNENVLLRAGTEKCFAAAECA